jgi:hypothetical protein
VRNSLRKYARNHVEKVWHVSRRDYHRFPERRVQVAKRLLDQDRFVCKYMGDETPSGYFGAPEIAEFIFDTYMKRRRRNRAEQSDFIDRISPAFIAFVCVGVRWELLRVSTGSDPGTLSPENCKSKCYQCC